MMMTLCDADHVAAATYAVFTAAGPLALCSHHTRTNMAAFNRRGYPVEDLAGVTIPAEWTAPPAYVGITVPDHLRYPDTDN